MVSGIVVVDVVVDWLLGGNLWNVWGKDMMFVGLRHGLGVWPCILVAS